MKRLFLAVSTALVVTLALAATARASDQAAAAATATHKAGDKVYVCGCGKSCPCQTLAAAPGKCHCGKDLVEGTVTKVSGGAVTVKTAQGEQVFHEK